MQQQDHPRLPRQCLIGCLTTMLAHRMALSNSSLAEAASCHMQPAFIESCTFTNATDLLLEIPDFMPRQHVTGHICDQCPYSGSESHRSSSWLVAKAVYVSSEELTSIVKVAQVAAEVAESLCGCPSSCPCQQRRLPSYKRLVKLRKHAGYVLLQPLQCCISLHSAGCSPLLAYTQ